MIAPMLRVLFAGRQSDRDTALMALREAGVIHIEPAVEKPVPPSAEVLHDIERTEKALAAIQSLKSAEGALPPPGTPSRLVEEIHNRLTALSKIEKEQAVLELEKPSVLPWGEIDRGEIGELSLSGLEFRAFVGPDKSADGIEAELVQTITERDGKGYYFAVSRKPITADFRFTPTPLPERDAVEIVEELARLHRESMRLRAELAEHALRRNEIAAFLAERKEQRNFMEVEGNLLHEGPVFVLRGWVPADSLVRFQELMTEARIPLALETSEPTDEDQPPTKFDNPWWCKPIESMYSILGVVPGYREADISPFFMPFLAVFTAMLIADAGYGLVGLIGLAIAYAPLRSQGVPRNALDLFLALFIATTAYGVISNAWFGTAPAMTSRFMLIPAGAEGEAFLKWLCFLIGSIHLSIAHLWKIKRAPIGLASLAEVGWIIFIWAMNDLINLLVLGGPTTPAPTRMVPMFQVSLGLVLFFTAPSMNILSMIGQGLGAIALNAAAFLSDIISYIRLWAVGLAGGILAANFNEMASGLPLVAAVVILIGAHLMNLALGLVAVFAHGVRLNLLEFSNHVGMEWAGKLFSPFRDESE